MSHFSSIQTCFQKLFYLEKALNHLNINFKKEEKVFKNDRINNNNQIIFRLNDHNMEFSWNGQEYEAVVDRSFWKQSYTIESFIQKIAKQYAGELIIGESQKIGFQEIQNIKNINGSNTLILERWN